MRTILCSALGTISESQRLQESPTLSVQGQLESEPLRPSTVGLGTVRELLHLLGRSVGSFAARRKRTTCS
jgi:hypothetical protein